MKHRDPQADPATPSDRSVRPSGPTLTESGPPAQKEVTREEKSKEEKQAPVRTVRIGDPQGEGAPQIERSADRSSQKAREKTDHQGPAKIRKTVLQTDEVSPSQAEGLTADAAFPSSREVGKQGIEDSGQEKKAQPKRRSWKIPVSSGASDSKDQGSTDTSSTGQDGKGGQNKASSTGQDGKGGQPVSGPARQEASDRSKAKPKAKTEPTQPKIRRATAPPPSTGWVPQALRDQGASISSGIAHTKDAVKHTLSEYHSRKKEQPAHRRDRKARRAALRQDPRAAVRAAAGSAILCFAVLFIALQLVWPAIPFYQWDIPNFGLTTYIISGITYHLVILLIPLFILFRVYHLSPELIMGTGGTTREVFLQTLLTGVMAGIFLRGLHNVIAYALTRAGLDLTDGALPIYPRSSSLFSLIPTLLLGAFLPAILEELFFRGVIQSGLSFHRHMKFGMFASAFIYMFAHGQDLIWIVPLGIGLLTARIRLIYDDVKTAIVLHLSIGTTLTLLQTVLPRFDAGHVMLSLSNSRAELFGSVLAMIIAGTLLWFFWSSIESRSPYGHRSRFAIRTRGKEKFLHPSFGAEPKPLHRCLSLGLVLGLILLIIYHFIQPLVS